MTIAHTEAPTLVGDNSLAAELLARRRKRLPAMTFALVILVAAALAFVGGIEAQRHWGTSTASASTASSSFAARFAARAQAGGGGGGGTFAAGGLGGAAGGTTGTVTLIKGSTLYVTGSAGNTVLVHTTAGTRVSKAASGTVKSIHPGDTVTVTGTQASDGSTTARQVTIGGGNG